MRYEIKNLSLLKKLLRSDFILGNGTAIIGFLCFRSLVNFLGLSSQLIIAIAVITFLYSIVAFILLLQKNISITLLRVLVSANWVWAVISTGIAFFHFGNATILGQLFLVLQIMTVGGLAYLEGKQIIPSVQENLPA